MTEPLQHTAADELFCPVCGYDLRMSEARCPECGRPFDRKELKVSKIPWVHRRDIGRIKAWLKTVWMVLRRPGDIGAEVARPVEWTDAKRFSWIAIWLAALILTTTAAATYRESLMDSFEVDLRPSSFPLTFRNPWEFPIYALWTGPAAIAVLFMAALAGGGAVMWWTRLWFWILSRAKRDRASAIACYGSTWLMLFGMLGAIDIIFWSFSITGDLGQFWYLFAPGLFGLHAVIVIAILLEWLRFLYKATNCGWPALLMATIFGPAGAITLFTVAAFVVNYLIGLLALMWQSL